jgi:hypothetical protein
VASELEQARQNVQGAWAASRERQDVVMDLLEEVVRRDERIRCWQEIQASMSELCQEDSPLARGLIGWESDLAGPGLEDVRWPVAVDRLLVPDRLLRAFDRIRPGHGYRSKDDQDD